MEYIEQTNGQRIKTKMGLTKYIEEQYTQDMFEQDLNDYHSMISFGTKTMGYGEVFRKVDCEGFEVEYRKAIDDKATQAMSGDYEVVKGLKLLPLDTPCNFTDAMMKMFDGETVWTTKGALGLSTVDNHPYYFRIICGELCYTIDPNEPLVDWDAVACLLRRVDLTEEIWHSFSEISKKE